MIARSEVEIDTPAPGRHPGGSVSISVAEPDGSGPVVLADNDSHAAPFAGTSGSATAAPVLPARVLYAALVGIGLEAVAVIALIVAWAVIRT